MLNYRVPMGMTLCALLTSAGCSDDKSDNDQQSGRVERDDESDDNADDPAEEDGEANADPIYLMLVAASDADGSGSLYAVLRNELDLDLSFDDFEQEKAREFEAYSGVAVIDGHVIVGDSKSPVGKKFEVSDDLEWTQVGNDLHFDDYVVNDTDGLNFYFQAIHGTDMYLYFGADRTSRLHWNVREWKLKQPYEDTRLPTRSGWTMGSTGNRTGMRDWQGPVVQTFNMNHDETYALSDESWIAVYDEDTHEEQAVIEVPCPGLAQTTMDEEGNLYVSTTFNTPTQALYGLQDPACVVRLNADGSQDEQWGNKQLGDFTGGFNGVNFRYLRDGKAVANVLHHDRIEDADWEGEVDHDVLVQIEGEWTDDGFTPQDPSLWELELIDIEAGTSQPITGFKPDHDPGSYTIFFPIEDRVFISFQIDPFGQARNALYELDTDTAQVTFVGDVDGELSGIERVR